MMALPATPATYVHLCSLAIVSWIVDYAMMMPCLRYSPGRRRSICINC